MAPSESIKCIVCSNTINPRTNASINYCSDCKKPCHTKCAGRKKDAPCDLCRAVEQRRQKKYDAIQQKRLSAESTPKSAANNTFPESKGEGVSSAMEEHSTSTPTTPNTNNISGKTERSAKLPTQLPRSRLSVFTPSPMEPDKRRQTLPPSNDTQKLDTSTVASQLSMKNTSISSLSSSLTTTMEPLSRKLDDLGVSVNHLPALQLQISTVCDGFRELDSLVRTQNSQLVELQRKQCDLMEENSKLKSTLTNFENNINIIIHDNFTKLENKITEKILSKIKNLEGNLLEEFQSIDQNFGNLTTGMATVVETVSDPDSPYQADPGPISELRKQSPKTNTANHRKLTDVQSKPSCKEGLHAEQHDGLVISCALDCVAANIEHIDFAYAVLSSVQPSIEKSEITEIRQLNRSVGSMHGTEARDVRGGSGGASALLVRLSSRDLVSQIMKNKHKITGLNTQHLDLTHFGQNITLPVASVFINEYLPSATYKEFQNLKSLAKKLGFKYIWHRGGQFLAKMREGERVFTYSTPTDLQAIAASYKDENTEAIKNLTVATPIDNVVINSSTAETTATAKNRNTKKAKPKKSKTNNNKKGSKNKDAS